MYWKWFMQWLKQPQTLWLLFFVNFFGTIYGYYWYKNQLLRTEWYLWPFVPDSPTASLFFTIALLGFILHKRWKFIEAFAAVTLFKYGIWATVTIVWSGALGAELNWQHYMLIFSHIGMAVQALLFIPSYSFGKRHLLLVAAWTLTNDFMDYTLGIFPSVNYRLHPYLPIVAIMTVSLSIISLAIFYWSRRYQEVEK